MNVTAIVIIAVIIVFAVVAILMVQRRRSQRLQTQFGPEYEKVVRREGSARKAESVLADRAKRIEKFHIRHLNQREQQRYAEGWRREQALFVDDPGKAVEGADTLVCEVMEVRGYPMSEFEQRAADISVDHAQVVDHYRAAHDIALRARRGQASTEDLRQAMVHYRVLFEDLLEERVTDPNPQEVNR